MASPNERGTGGAAGVGRSTGSDRGRSPVKAGALGRWMNIADVHERSKKMRSRGLVVAIAVVLAIVAAAAVILYTNGVKSDAVTRRAPSSSCPSRTSRRTRTSTLIDEGVFSELKVPTDAVVGGAVTSVTELRGQTTTAPCWRTNRSRSRVCPAARLPRVARSASPKATSDSRWCWKAARRLRQHPARRQRGRVRDLQGGRVRAGAPCGRSCRRRSSRRCSRARGVPVRSCRSRSSSRSRWCRRPGC